MRRGRIRNELVLGLAAVVIASSLVTYAVVLFAFFRDFDSLLEKNDLTIAASYAAALSDHYARRGSWDGAAVAIEEQERLSFARDERRRDEGRLDDHRPPKKHPADDGVPLVLLDDQGRLVYSGFRTRAGEPDQALANQVKTAEGEPVLVGGKAVGYVFFKSMVLRSYNPQERAFVSSLSTSIGVSVGLGLLLALGLGSLLAARFALPISTLDAAVRNIAEGDLSARVSVARHDEIGGLADSFNRMADRLQATEAARQNLLADMAHELRTPVSIIQANLEMVIDGVYSPDPERLKAIYDETRILAGLISDLRALSDLESSSGVHAPEAVDVGALAAESREKLAPQLDARGLDVDLSSCPGALVLADADQVRQVLRNLLVNALKYSPDGSRITVAVERLPGSDGNPAIRTTVADEGPGVPPEALERIFERFYRVDPSRNRESGGRGLGLAICKRIVESSGGCMGAYRRDPSGLAVWFELPEA